MRRTTILLSLAAVGPVLVFAAMTAAGSFRDQVRQSEALHLAQAREVNARVDGELMANLSALSVLSSITTISARDWRAARQRAIQVMKLRPTWRDMFLTDAKTRLEVWNAQNDIGAPRPARAHALAFLGSPSTSARIADLGGVGAGCPCFVLHQPIYDGPELRYLLTAEIRVDEAKRILDAHVAVPDVGAIVDRNGNFIARTLLHARRLGHPSSTFVRATLRGPRSGVYDGVTIEGLSNRTVYETSNVSGFATHIALPRRDFTLLGAGSLALRLTALLLSLAIAIAGIVYALREQRRWRVEEQRAGQAQKLEALGRFASGIAHDFNNLLSVIISCLNRLEKQLEDSQNRSYLEHARTAAWQGADLVKQVLNFAREAPPELDSVVLADVLTQIEPLLRETLPTAATIAIEPVKPDEVVVANRAQLESALLNLARNAADAMPNGGSITVRTKAARDPACIDLVVEDTGQGMAPEVLQRALDPFFTTKPAGKGTGLGLAQIQSLMMHCGGKIEIVSKVAQGTTVIMRFQRAK